MEDNGSTTDSETISKKNNEDEIIAVILVSTLILLIILGVYIWINRKKYGFVSQVTKQPAIVPREREIYYKAKAEIPLDDPNRTEELKKLLMRRAMFTIPMVLSLQNSGTSVQRLYNQGMLTDDIYEGVKETKAFVDAEFPEVQMEADELHEGWGAHIWPEAMRFHQMLQQHTEEKQKEQSTERMSTEKRQQLAEKRRQKTKLLKRENEAKRKAEEAEKAARELIEEENKKQGKKNA
mmetsp:Transcript_4951/g.7558  ORF Transcript_4951/g.7558 Transcript_4951/m.7558 type:complete len:237 (+) Transcript_4951:78-788(+)